MTSEPPAHPGRSAPPRLVDISRWLWIGSAVAGAVRLVVQLADRELLISEISRVRTGLSQDEIDAVVNGGILFGLLLAAGLVVLYSKLANRMARGRNWARVLLTVLGAGTIFFALARLLAVGSGVTAAFGLVISPVDLVVSTVTGLVDGVALTLMFLPSVSSHFRRVENTRSSGHHQ